ncbi:MAG: hypothetical protein ACXWP4_18710 [Polyangiales bacterium]
MVKYLLPLLLLSGCRPEFEDRSSELKRLRVLAIRSDPAEAAPGTDVRYTALIADDQGGYTGLPLDWAFCTKPRPLDEPNAVSVKCFAGEAGWLELIGKGDSVVGTLPNNGCRQFGSDVPEPKEGEPPGRPADPDPTGGYYQPARLIVDGPQKLLALGQTRLICGLPGATREVSEKFRIHYAANANPAIAGVEIVGGAPISFEKGAAAPVVAAGSSVIFRVSWPACPASTRCGDGVCGFDEDATQCKDDCTTLTTCGGAERYLQYDLVTRELVERTESMRASWLATAGEWDQDRTGREEGDPATNADNTWHAPSAPGKYTVFVVLRDARGGVDWRAFGVEVR